MLTTIEQLEQEIEQFHKNIASSNELIRLMKTLIDAISSQTESINIKSESLEAVIALVPDTIRSDYTTMLNQFSNEQKSYVDVMNIAQSNFKDFIENIQKYISAIPENVAKTNSEIVKVVEEALFKLKTLKTDFEKEIDIFSSRIAEFQKQIKTIEDNIAEKYNAFLSKLEILDVALIVELCHDMQSTLAENISENQRLLEAQSVKFQNEAKNAITNIDEKYNALLSRLESLSTEQSGIKNNVKLLGFGIAAILVFLIVFYFIK